MTFNVVGARTDGGLHSGMLEPESAVAPELVFDDPDDDDPDEDKDVSHFSEWSREHKARFLSALESNAAQDWVICLGNEAGGQSGSPAAAKTESGWRLESSMNAHVTSQG